MSDVLALLPDTSLRRLSLSVPVGIAVARVTIVQAERALAAGSRAPLVVDPAGFHGDDIFSALVGAATRAGVGVLAYSHFSTPLAARRVVDVVHVTALEILGMGVPDEARLLDLTLANIAQPSVNALVFQGIARNLKQLHVALQTALVGLLAYASIPESTAALARCVGVDQSTLRRWMRDAGLHGCDRFMSGVRLTRTYSERSCRDVSVNKLAAAGGFRSIRTLENRCRQFTLLSPREAVKALTAEQYAERIIRGLLL